jgi:hypothetical protein
VPKRSHNKAKAVGQNKALCNNKDFIFSHIRLFIRILLINMAIKEGE